MRLTSLLVRSALLTGAAIAGVLGCQQNEQRPARTPAAAAPALQPASSPPPQVAAPSAAPPPLASPVIPPASPPATASRPAAPAEPVAGAEPALFVRLGEALMPLGCQIAEAWRAGEECLGGEEPELVTLHPRLEGEAPARVATPASIPFMVSGAAEPGLLLVEAEREGAETDRPLLGFGVARSAGLVRFARGAARQIAEEAKLWCDEPDSGCRGVAEGALLELPERPWRAEERREMLALVRQASASLGDQLTVEVGAGFEVKVGGRAQRLLVAALDTGNVPAEKAARLDLPSRLHYLLAKTPTGLRLLSVLREYDLGLGEAGELVGAIDLDADGTDELILEWHYSEGRSWQLARRDGDQLVVVGSFTDGA